MSVETAPFDLQYEEVNLCLMTQMVPCCKFRVPLFFPQMPW